MGGDGVKIDDMSGSIRVWCSHSVGVIVPTQSGVCGGRGNLYACCSKCFVPHALADVVAENNTLFFNIVTISCIFILPVQMFSTFEIVVIVMLI